MVSKKNASSTQVLWCIFKQLLLVTRISRIWKRGIHGLFNSFEYKKLSLYSHTVEISTHTINFIEENFQEVSVQLASLRFVCLSTFTRYRRKIRTFNFYTFRFWFQNFASNGTGTFEKRDPGKLLSFNLFTWGLARPRNVIKIVSFASRRLRKRERKKKRLQIRQWAYWELNSG